MGGEEGKKRSGGSEEAEEEVQVWGVTFSNWHFLFTSLSCPHRRFILISFFLSPSLISSTLVPSTNSPCLFNSTAKKRNALERQN